MTSAGVTPSTLTDPAPVTEFDPLLGEDEAAAMLSLCDAFGGYGMYSNEGFETAYAPELPQRVDAVLNYLAGKEGTNEDVAAVAVLLASDAGAGITGAQISIDGGTSPY